MAQVPAQLSEAELKGRRRRSLVLALVLVGMAVIFYVLTIVKMGAGVFERVL